MNRIKLSIFSAFIFSGLYAQKPAIDTSVFGHWARVGGAAISADGRYAMYTKDEGYKTLALVIQSLQGKWRAEIAGAGAASFTGDGRKVIYRQGNDSLCLLTLGGTSTEYITHVAAFRLLKQGHGEWLIYQLNTLGKELVLHDLATGRDRSYPGVTDYWLSKDAHVLVLMTGLGSGADQHQSLSWVNTTNNEKKQVWEGVGGGNLIMDSKGQQLAFVVERKMGEKAEKAFWYYKEGMTTAVMLADNGLPGIDAGLHLEGLGSFSRDGSRIFVNLKEEDLPKADPDAVKVDVWSYTDQSLQSVQLESGDGPKSYLAVLNIQDRHLLRLQQKGEDVGIEDSKCDDFAFVNTGSWEERNWNKANKRHFYLEDTRTGARKELGMGGVAIGTTVSPSGRYLILGDDKWRDFYCYDRTTGVPVNITKGLPGTVEDEDYDDGGGDKPRGITLDAWMEGEKAVIIRDKYDDLWKLDVTGQTAPVSLTNEYARRKNIRFRICGGLDYREKTVEENEALNLCAFNEDNKDNGFYRIVVGKIKDPELLTMGPYIYSMPVYPRSLPDFNPIKASRANVWVVSRESASESPNFFWTTDFKTYNPISDTYPEKNYNWLSSEVVHYQTIDGKTESGILYKPENFDASKKYPVIIHYYERLAQRKNVYEQPEASYGDVNVFWFASHGYLVFTPDIHYKIGFTGESAFNSIVGAAKHLAGMPWVDGKRMGIQGGSFGGFETNYVVTHTDIFAAAVVRAGPSDLISGYGALWGGGGGNQTFYEIDQIRLGATLWQNPDLYINNSPIFHADRVTTPILLMHNKKDGAVPFAQGVEFFTALRRLGKRAWLLQYDGEDHVIIKDKGQLDFTIRMTQFFDHYLKGAAAPVWMTRGIPAKMKGIDDGLKLDTEIKTPGEGLLMH